MTALEDAAVTYAASLGWAKKQPDPKPWAAPITPDPAARIKALQTRVGVTADGVFGAQTLAAVENALTPPAPVAPKPGALFVADGSTLTPWAAIRDTTTKQAEGLVSVVDDPLGQRGKVFQFDCPDRADKAPRAQVETAVLAREGVKLWTAVSYQFPTDGFPTTVGMGSWMSICEWYGYPFNGTGITPALSFRGDTAGGQRLSWTGTANNFAEIYKTPVVRDTWHDFLLYTEFTTGAGRAELWLSTGGKSYAKVAEYAGPTLRPDNTKGLTFNVQNYRGSGSVKGNVRIYAADVRIDPDRAKVALR